MKVAPRHSSELHGVQPGSSDSAVEMSVRGESPFSILVDLVLDEDAGWAMGAAHSDLPMLDPGSGQAHLNWAHSYRPKWRGPSGSGPSHGAELGQGEE